MQTLTTEEKEIVTMALLAQINQLAKIIRQPYISDNVKNALQADIHTLNNIIDKLNS